MKRLPIIALVCIASFTALGQQKGKDPFVGLHREAVIAKYGKPSVIEKDKKGGEVLIYKRVNQVAGVSASKVDGMYISKGKRTYSFILDKAGKVVAWKAS